MPWTAMAIDRCSRVNVSMKSMKCVVRDGVMPWTVHGCRCKDNMIKTQGKECKWVQNKWPDGFITQRFFIYLIGSMKCTVRDGVMPWPVHGCRCLCESYMNVTCNLK